MLELTDDNYRIACVPKRFWHLEPRDYRCPPGDPDALRVVKEWDLRDGVGMVLYGDPGGGKSMLASLLVARALACEVNAAFVTSHAFVSWTLELMSLRTALENFSGYNGQVDNNRRPTTMAGFADELDERYVNVQRRLWSLTDPGALPLLVLDDLGAEHRTRSQFAVDELEAMVRLRYANGDVTVVTTNYGSSHVKEHYGETFASFLRELGPSVEVHASDYREDMHR